MKQDVTARDGRIEWNAALPSHGIKAIGVSVRICCGWDCFGEMSAPCAFEAHAGYQPFRSRRGLRVEANHDAAFFTGVERCKHVRQVEPCRVSVIQKRDQGGYHDSNSRDKRPDITQLNFLHRLNCSQGDHTTIVPSTVVHSANPNMPVLP